MKKASTTIILLIQLVISSIALANVWTVDLNGSGDYSDIQSALDSAIIGDTIIVNEGVYRGDRNTNLNFQGKAITLKSSKGSSKTIIDCFIPPDIYGRETMSRAFYFFSGEDANSVVDGFTIRNGNQLFSSGGGIYCSDSSPTFLNCVMENCVARNGGGFYGRNCKSTFKDCQFKNNYAENIGGGLHITSYDSEITLERCEIKNNQSNWEGGGIALRDCRLSLYNCIVLGNIAEQGAAIYGNRFDAFNCTFTKNESYYDPIFANSYNSHLTNCIVWDNESQYTNYYDLYCSYCIVQGEAWGEHVLYIDPLITADGHLQKESPCIDAGDPYWFLNIADFDDEYPNVDSRTDIGCDQYVDLDQDGLPNWWELKFYGDMTIADPSSDTDADGDDAIKEYKNSTNPLGAYYVDANGNDDWDGLAPEWNGLHGPKETIQDAIDTLDEGAEIIVNNGIYTGPGNRDISIINKNIYLHSAEGSDNCIIDCNGTPDDPHFAFSIGSATGLNQAVLEGFKITNAYNASVQEFYPWQAGAIYIYGTGNPIIRNCDISENYTTGIVTRAAECEIIGCQLSNNINGALTVINESHRSHDPRNLEIIKITNCKMYGNFSFEHGSAVNIQQMIHGFFPNGQPVFTNCVIAGNYSLSGHGAIYQDGFGTFINCTITDNRGGAVFAPFHINPSMLGYYNTIISKNSPYNIEPDYGYWQGRDSCFISNEIDPLFRSKGIWTSDLDPNVIIEPDMLHTLWIPGDYHLLPDSPCVDNGNNRWAMDYFDIDNDGVSLEEELPFDMDWKIRIADGDDNDSNTVDIGAYELSNQPPIAVAEPNQIDYAWIDGYAQVQLDGSGSSDADGDVLSYLWSWTIDGFVYEADGVSPVIDLPIGIHEVKLVVNDGSIDSERDYLTCEVISPIRCNGSIKPRVLAGKGKKLKIVLELPDSLSSVDFNDSEPWVIEPAGVESIDNSFSSKKRKKDYLLLEFNKFEVKNGFTPGDNQIDVVGKLKNGRYIYFSDSIITKK